jgi:hypothetical protein
MNKSWEEWGWQALRLIDSLDGHRGLDHSRAIAEAKSLMQRILEIDRRPRLAGTDSDSVTIIDNGTG